MQIEIDAIPELLKAAKTAAHVTAHVAEKTDRLLLKKCSERLSAAIAKVTGEEVS